MVFLSKPTRCLIFDISPCSQLPHMQNGAENPSQLIDWKLKINDLCRNFITLGTMITCSVLAHNLMA